MNLTIIGIVHTVFFFVIVVTALFVIIKHVKLIIKTNRLNKYLYNYVNMIVSARYGNLNVKSEDGVDALTIQLSRNTNALLESIKDRDAMINEYIEKEKQSQNLKQDFVSSLAHDLKVPIIAQDNTYDLFLNGNFGELSKIQKQAIENLKLSNNDLKNLVLDLLQAHKMESEDIKLNLEKTNIYDFINDAIEQNKSILTLQNKKINFNSKNKDIELNIDRLLFKRVLNNLISNAIFYGKNSDEIDLDLVKDGSNTLISVTDYGDGIKEEEIGKIFSKYYTSAKKYSKIGVGLGLYIANKIILSHGGELSVKNIPSKGACFIIKL